MVLNEVQCKTEWEIIHGRVAGHGEVTLYRCCDAAEPKSLEGISLSSVYAKYAFVGWHFSKTSEIEFSEIFVTMDGLKEWIGKTGISKTRCDESSGFTIRADAPEDIPVTLTSGRTLEIRFDFAESKTKSGYGATIGEKTIYETTVKPRAFISYKETCPMKFDHAFQMARAIRNFLCFATDTPLPITSISAYPNDDPATIPSTRPGQSQSKPVSLFYQSDNRDAPQRPIDQQSMLFTYRDVADRRESIIEEWFRLFIDARAPLDLFFVAANGASDYLEGNFLTITRAIEVIHRLRFDHGELNADEFETRLNAVLQMTGSDAKLCKWVQRKLKWSNRLTFRTRIHELMKPFEKQFGDVQQRNALISLLVETRNDLTHEGESELHLKGDLETILILKKKLDVLFIMTIMRLLGFETGEIESLIERNVHMRSILETPVG